MKLFDGMKRMMRQKEDAQGRPDSAKKARPDFMKRKPDPSTPLEEKRRFLIGRCMEVLAEMIPEHIPEAGKCRPCYVCCDFPGSRNEARLTVQCDGSNAVQRRLTASVVRQGTDLCIMNYIFCGTRSEIISWLEDWSHLDELMESLVHLSETVDDKMD